MKELTFYEKKLEDLYIPLKASVSGLSGSANFEAGISITPGRDGLQPALSLAYSSGGGNSVFGAGWSLQGIPSITLSLKSGYPRYDKLDRYSFGGQELIPWLDKIGGKWQERINENEHHFIHYYRTTVDPSFTRIEKWTDKLTRNEHWRVHSINNQVMVFGKSPDQSTQVYDPRDQKKIFQWLLESQYDNIGNCVEYEYVAEDLANVNGNLCFERNRV
ncbi:MAG: SpvB/TcaC N-terminal domain-containing protein, partial [Ferruginibacter sp.]